MRRPASRGKKPAASRPQSSSGPVSGVERAGTLLERLRSGGPNPVQAAEELDRLQAALQRQGELESVREDAADVAVSWLSEPLRGDRAHAWLVLVGGFGLEELAPQAAALAADSGLAVPLRARACRVLGALGGEEATAALQAVLLAPGDAQLRAHAAEALAEARDLSALPVLEALLEEDLPRSLWTAVSAALERLRGV